ncbi:MAG: DUF3987 domain-containing protein [Burkholderiales bacterium]
MRLCNLEHLLEKEMANEPQKPIAKRMLFNNATAEAMRDAANCSAYSFAIVSDEGGNVFNSHATKDLTFFNDGYSGTPIRVDRKTSPNIFASGYAMSVMLMPQKSVMQSFLARKKGRARGDGFLSRFFIVFPASTRGYKMLDVNKKTTNAIKQFQSRIAEMINVGLTQDAAESCLNLQTLSLTEEGRRLYTEFHNMLQIEMRPGGKFFEDQDLASRAAENALRLACVFHVYEQGANGKISADTFDRAAVIALWFLHQSQRILTEFSRPQEESDAQYLYNWLLSEYRNANAQQPNYYQNNLMPVSHIYLNLRPDRMRKKEVLMAAIQALVDRGIVQYLTKPKPANLLMNANFFNRPAFMVANIPIQTPMTAHQPFYAGQR